MFSLHSPFLICESFHNARAHTVLVIDSLPYHQLYGSHFFKDNELAKKHLKFCKERAFSIRKKPLLKVIMEISMAQRYTRIREYTIHETRKQ
jgi:hypothetical protein